MIDLKYEEELIKEVRNKVVNLEKEIIASNTKVTDVQIVEYISKVLEEIIKKYEDKTNSN